MTETDLNGRQDDRDGPKWPAPARVKGMVGWEDRNGPKWPAPAKGRGGVKWDDRDGPKWPAPAIFFVLMPCAHRRLRRSSKRFFFD